MSLLLLLQWPSRRRGIQQGHCACVRVRVRMRVGVRVRARWCVRVGVCVYVCVHECVFKSMLPQIHVDGHLLRDCRPQHVRLFVGVRAGSVDNSTTPD